MAIKRWSFDEFEPNCMYHPKPGCVHPAEEGSGKFISSLSSRKPDMHAPALDIDFPTTVELGTNGKTRITIVGPKPTHRNILRLLDTLLALQLMDRANLRAVAPRRATNNRRKLPALVLDVLARADPSSTPGHFHLYLEKEMEWSKYERLLTALREAEVIGKDFYEMCIEWRVSFLLKPEYKKSDFKLKFDADATALASG